LVPFVRGFFDAEGDVGPTYIGFSQKNGGVLSFLKHTLNKLGIRTGEIHVIDEKTRTKRIVISGKKNINKFVMLIGSNHPVKKRRLRTLKRAQDSKLKEIGGGAPQGVGPAVQLDSTPENSPGATVG